MNHAIACTWCWWQCSAQITAQLTTQGSSTVSGLLDGVCWRKMAFTSGSSSVAWLLCCMAPLLHGSSVAWLLCCMAPVLHGSCVAWLLCCMAPLLHGSSFAWHCLASCAVGTDLQRMLRCSKAPPSSVARNCNIAQQRSNLWECSEQEHNLMVVLN